MSCYIWSKAIEMRYAWLTHWGQVTHLCVSKLTIIGSDIGLSPDRRQAIIWTNRKWQDYVYIQCEYKSTKQKIKHLLREENKVKENKIS